MARDSLIVGCCVSAGFVENHRPKLNVLEKFVPKKNGTENQNTDLYPKILYRYLLPFGFSFLLNSKSATLCRKQDFNQPSTFISLSENDGPGFLHLHWAMLIRFFLGNQPQQRFEKESCQQIVPSVFSHRTNLTFG